MDFKQFKQDLKGTPFPQKFTRSQTILFVTLSLVIAFGTIILEALLCS